jgi:hypothetical protein
MQTDSRAVSSTRPDFEEVAVGIEEVHAASLDDCAELSFRGREGDVVAR